MAKKDARRGKRRVRLTPVSTYHYFRLVYRSVLLLAVLIFYIRYRLNMGGSGAEITKLLEGRPVVLGILWLVFAVEMVLRFFPARLESPGSQKQFARNYIRTGETNIQIPDNNGTGKPGQSEAVCPKLYPYGRDRHTDSGQQRDYAGRPDLDLFQCCFRGTAHVRYF